MTEFFSLIRSFYQDIIDLFNSTIFTIGGFETSLAGIIFACVVIGFVVNLYWKGVKT